MKSYNRIPAVAAIAFAASLSFSIVACDDSSSASGDDVPDSSDSGAALGSSGSVPAGMEGLPDDVLASYSILPQCGDEIVHPEGSCNSITGADGKAYLFECVGTQWVYNQDCEEPMCLTAASKAEHPECQFPECNAESEGLVQEMEAGSSRLRPVLMTTLTTILGMLPMCFASSGSAGMVQPIGVAVVGGLTSSTFVTLFFIPVLYSLIMNEKKVKKSRIKVFLEGKD